MDLDPDRTFDTEPDPGKNHSDPNTGLAKWSVAAKYLVSVVFHSSFFDVKK